MARYSRTQLEGMDLNIFFQINGVPLHIATMGKLIPLKLNDSKRIVDNWQSVKSLPYSTQFRLNRDYLDQIATHSGYEYLSGERLESITDIVSTFPSMDVFDIDVPLSVKLYSWSFVEMARKGFYSFAPKENVEGEVDDRIKFILISSPFNPLDNGIDNFLHFQVPNFSIDNNVIENEGIYLLDMAK